MFAVLSEIRFIGIRALAFARYEQDFYATREATLGGGDFYTFKDVYEAEPQHSLCRERTERFVPLLFGEVQGVEDLVGFHGFAAGTYSPCVARGQGRYLVWVP